MKAPHRILAGFLLTLAILCYAGEAAFSLVYLHYQLFEGWKVVLLLTLWRYLPALLGTGLLALAAGLVIERFLLHLPARSFPLRIAKYCTAPTQRQMAAATLGLVAGLLHNVFAPPAPWSSFWVLPRQNTYGSLWVNVPEVSWPTPYAYGSGVMLGMSWALRRLYKRWLRRIPSFAPPSEA